MPVLPNKKEKQVKRVFHILLVEDDRELRRLYRSVLIKSGYSVTEAENGKQALNVFEEEHIDMMICDAMMPKMDGYAVSYTHLTLPTIA